MITVLTASDEKHIDDRHGPEGDADSNFDRLFLNWVGGYGKLVKEILDHGVGAPEEDASGRLIYKYYCNFNRKTGTGVDREGKAVLFKGAEMVGTQSALVFFVETAYPKGIIKT
ncbi:MAG TPA: hypothetical protein VMS40_04430 [Vicinamibacterales bacterium]|nr:hypothetical protein [Vicinamibacterales bacterium]